jgi:alkanesulfonate monooxygenase SsuD/methylene tetrahydromethanopterin reductase-like flavin-dependent oxidoreductase (luciferase family)
MKIGTNHAFQCPPWTEPGRVFAEEIERVQASERLGFESAWLGEQHFSPYAICGDVLAMASHLLGVTERIKIGTAVVNLTFTNPLRFLERVAILDHISNGRLEVGIGRGYQVPQYEVMGVDIARSRELFDENLDIVLAAWEGEEIDHHGSFYDFSGVRVLPSPSQAPEEILLMAAAQSPESFTASVRRRIPAIISRSFEPVADEIDTYENYRGQVADAGLDLADFMGRVQTMRYVHVAPTREQALEEARGPLEWHMAMLKNLMSPDRDALQTVNGDYDPEANRFDDAFYEALTADTIMIDDPEGLTERLALLRDAGVTRMIAFFGAGGMERDLQLRAMRLFADQVMPRL